MRFRELFLTTYVLVSSHSYFHPLLACGNGPQLIPYQFLLGLSHLGYGTRALRFVPMDAHLV